MGGSSLSLTDVRRLWPDIIESTKHKRRLTWMLLTNNAQVVDLDASTLTLGFDNGGARDSFEKSGSDEIVRQSVIDVVGADWTVRAIIDASNQPPAPPPVSAPAPEPEPAPVAETPRSDLARQAITATRNGGGPGREQPDPQAHDSEASPDDADLDDSGLAGAELLQRELGAKIIEEIKHD